MRGAVTLGEINKIVDHRDEVNSDFLIENVEVVVDEHPRCQQSPDAIKGMAHGSISPSRDIVMFKNAINEYDGWWWNIEVIIILMIVLKWECIQCIRDVWG